jgi:hypothetical protein
MFRDTKHTRWYWALVERARIRKLATGYQKHHVIPRCLGGSNEATNLIRVTPREHYICHLLLVKMTYGRARSKMVFAFFRFNPKDTHVTTSLSYERFIASFKSGLSGDFNHFYGKKHTPETRSKISQNHGMRGRSCYDVWIEQYGKEEADRRKSVMVQRRSVALMGERNHRFGVARTQKQRETHAAKMTGANNPNWGKAWAWINRSGKTKRVLKTALDPYLLEGWALGRT